MTIITGQVEKAHSSSQRPESTDLFYSPIPGPSRWRTRSRSRSLSSCCRSRRSHRHCSSRRRRRAHYTPHIRSMPKGYIVFVCSISPFVCPSFCLSVNPFYNQVLLRSFLLLITLQPLIKNFSYLVWGYLGGSIPFYLYGPLGHAPGRG